MADPVQLVNFLTKQKYLIALLQRIKISKDQVDYE